MIRENKEEIIGLLKNSINKTRTKLHDLIDKQNNVLMMEEILKVSEELDQLIKNYLQLNDEMINK